MTRDHIDAENDELQLSEIWSALHPHLKKIFAWSVAAGMAAYGISLLIPPTYTARASIISPQQQQSAAASALASLGALAGVAGGAVKSPTDQYISIMQSATVSNRIIDRFRLIELYEAKYRSDAWKSLANNVRITAGKKDNLISIEIDDVSPQRAADMANAYIEELRWVTNNLALTEAQQRRAFFEQQLIKTKDALRTAQTRVQKAGFTAGALKSEPKAAAEVYARTKAEIAAAEVKLGSLRRSLTDNSPEIQQQQAVLASLRGQLAQYEQPMESESNQDYVSAYREFKYQEALFDIYAKQFELAKMDEARDGTLIQVLDAAAPPERRSKPKRMMIAAATAMLTGLALTLFFAIRGIARQRKGS